MGKPLVKSGRFTAGADLTCGENVVVEVAEECVVGDRAVLPDNAYLGGRRVTIADDFYGYSWDWKRLDVGRGRIDDEYAVFTVGSRCTLHDGKIDLARPVTLGDDVGLSPEVAIYGHYYWQSPLDGFPCKYAPVLVESGSIVGFRSVLLPGAVVPKNAVVGAQSVVVGELQGERGIYVGNPARWVRAVLPPAESVRRLLFEELVRDYGRSRGYRRLGGFWGGLSLRGEFPTVEFAGCRFDLERRTVEGTENEDTDDLREFLFKKGVRLYTKRPFRKLGRKA